jgi:hypothetical protein
LAVERETTIEKIAAFCVSRHLMRDASLRADPLDFIERHMGEISSALHKLRYPETSDTLR